MLIFGRLALVKSLVPRSAVAKISPLLSSTHNDQAFSFTGAGCTKQNVNAS